MTNDETNQISALQSAHQDQFIEHPDCTHVLNNLDYVYELARMKSRPFNLIVAGDSGSGKTSILNHFIKKIEKQRILIGDEIPKLIAKIDMPEAATRNKLLARIAGAFGVGNFESMNKGQFVVHVVERGLKLVLIDEFHNLDSAQKMHRLAILQTLKWFGNELGLSLVISGTNNVSRVLLHDEQLEKRFKVVSIPNWKTGHNFNSFVFLYLANVLKEDAPTEMNGATLDTLLNKSQGRMYDVVRILSQSAYEAAKDNNIAGIENYIRDIGDRTSYV